MADYDPTKSPEMQVHPTGSSHQHAPSIISSRMTDIGSEDGDEFYAGVLGSDPRPGTAASTNAHRPGSALSSQTRPSTRATPSRRGLGSPGSLNTLRAGGTLGIGGSVTDSRPTTSTSRTSRTHVPLASHAFFNPMSSQRLQAQRAARPPRGHTPLSGDGASDTRNSTRRNSMTTNPTEYQDHAVQLVHDRPLQSRGTDYSGRDDRTITNASPEGKTTIRSYGDSERPLHQTINGHGPKESTGRGHSGSSEASPSFMKSPPPIGQPGINYEYFSGNTVFCLGGRLQNTRDRPINIASGLFVVVPSLLFLIFSGPYLTDNASAAVPFFYAYLFFVCMSSFIHASLTDPGILPRNLHPMPRPESDDPLAIAPPLTEWAAVRTSGANDTVVKFLPVKYCKTCNIWRPPRCHHCRICDNCIETQDHHCVWINNCVGRRNYRYFFSFVSTGTLLGFYLMFGSLGHCLHYASSNHVSFNNSIDVNRVPFAMFIYAIVATAYPACLWGYHLWLIARGETTREYLNSHKFPKKDRHRAFTHGNIWKNWMVVLLRPRTPTYLRFKAQYEEGDQRFGPRRGKRQAPLVAEQQGGGGMELRDVVHSRHA